MEAGTTLPPPPFWAGGPAPGQVHDPIAPGPAAGVQALTRTLNPMVTGTSVLGAKFDGGVMIAADMMGSYGSLARFRGISRLLKVNDTTALGASGDYADFQYLAQVIDQMVWSQLQPESHSFLADTSHVQPEVQDQSALEHRCHRRLLQRRERFPGGLGLALGLAGAFWLDLSLNPQGRVKICPNERRRACAAPSAAGGFGRPHAAPGRCPLWVIAPTGAVDASSDNVPASAPITREQQQKYLLRRGFY
uniref:Proteasome subunit beta type-4 n=1 Tax=Amazona collaria TaxID=241587 RepID=A0A8B9G6G0_9PSIT